MTSFSHSFVFRVEAPRTIEDKPVNSRLYIPCTALHGFNSSKKHIKASCFSDGIYRFSEETAQQCNDSFVKKPTEGLSKHVQAILYPFIPSNVFSLAKGWFASLLSTFPLTHNSSPFRCCRTIMGLDWSKGKVLADVSTAYLLVGNTHTTVAEHSVRHRKVVRNHWLVAPLYCT